MEQDKQIDRVLTSWCRIQENGSWFVQGAESMVCLVVLDSCLYTMVFWVLCSSLATCVSLLGLLWPAVVPIVESFHALCSYATVILGFFLVVEWWGYGAYFIDQAYLHSLSLSWKYGPAFLVLIASTLLSTLAARITWHMAITTRSNYAQLHAATPISLDNAATPAATREQQLQECQQQNVDPLQCPPNYQV
uniref:Transmembrane protein n=1 Tax=Globisporangium ultimum (strain ATCC 200006 / CBS 805.95 / DAOM BR144) TaxID=431595 RepID=K3W599_GLOUD